MLNLAQTHTKKKHSLHLKSNNIEQNFEPMKFYCGQGPQHSAELTIMAG